MNTFVKLSGALSGLDDGQANTAALIEYQGRASARQQAAERRVRRRERKRRA